MKIKRNLIFALTMTLGFYACDKKDGEIQSNKNQSLVLETLLSKNGLNVETFIEDGKNKTNLLDNYLFTFNSNSTVTATKDSKTINGTYLVFNDDNNTELKMTFPNNSELHELTDDWYFISKNNNLINFQDDNDILQFKTQ